MNRRARILGCLLCLAGALALIWAAREAVSQWVALLWQDPPGFSDWFGVLITAGLGLCVARLGLVMSHE
jgi:hypothetical protein